MRLFKLSNLLLVGLVLTMAGVGCKKKPTPLTKLPGYGPGTVGSEDDKTGGVKRSDTPITGNETGIPASDTWDPSNYTEDRAALEAQTVHFDFDSSAVKSSEKSKVDMVASALKSDAPAKLMIEGHCDERGTEEYNRALGEKRAQALRETLATMGLDPSRVRTVSYGEDRPVATGHDESAWKQNRRGVFVLMHPK